jgi:hypothetical protein
LLDLRPVIDVYNATSYEAIWAISNVTGSISANAKLICVNELASISWAFQASQDL